MSAPPPNQVLQPASTTTSGAAPGCWDFRWFALVFAATLVLQVLLLPCLCHAGNAKMSFALLLDSLMAGRAALAYFGVARGVGWKPYAWVLGTSPLWIEAIAFLVLGER